MKVWEGYGRWWWEAALSSTKILVRVQVRVEVVEKRGILQSPHHISFGIDSLTFDHFPPSLDEIESTRQEATTLILESIKAIIDEYQTSIRLCVEHCERCDARTLGMLLQSLKRHGLAQLSMPLYHGISFDSLGFTITDMRLITFCFELLQDRTPAVVCLAPMRHPAPNRRFRERCTVKAERAYRAEYSCRGDEQENDARLTRTCRRLSRRFCLETPRL